MSRALVILPTYNERENIEQLVGEILGLEELPVDVLVVDDNSPDETWQLVEEMRVRDTRVHLLRREGKLGLGTAYVAGFDYGLRGGYELLATMDADFSHHPRYLPSILAALKNHELVIGSRYVRGGGVENWEFWRRGLSWGANRMAKLLLGLKPRDNTSGYRGYRRELLEKVGYKRIHSQGYSFLMEMVYWAEREGFSIGEVPIIFTERRRGRSKINRGEIINAFRTLLRLRLGL